MFHSKNFFNDIYPKPLTFYDAYCNPIKNYGEVSIEVLWLK